ncbi:hypothetical protein A3A55_03845 [Candidatus Roizmanbacteria bacterium RIFCSPLOWO2_01_FULL_40_14]|uniref:Uncharacterized protein n=1 Tax=Candidatus Roizmanbacteria bacterium GW2011_GWC2_41_7 TaxID=1618487 RepID=A0A0G0XC01_9BACT|nr:MAG: hypothetical protein UU78_C0017G0014 [Candidatus Roizmanbacteria bacterium GW2011_GWC2_41_7]OGK50751.1 MAG: hypothetical protein A3A55_03845 [Candidatus Roizmanbacteria bacterium RIFCSPLOWO2_01_FULL_40_14]
MKHDVQGTAKATAVTVAVIYIVCALGVLLFSNVSMTIAQSWFHGLDLSKIYTSNVTVGSFILGLVTSTTGGWLIGYVFATAYNYFVKK